MNQQEFNPRDHLIPIKSRGTVQDYLPVQWRLVWFREACPHGTIETQELEVDTEKSMTVEVIVWNPDKRRNEKVLKTAKGYARFKATVTDGKGGSATGTKSECFASFPDYVEKAETGAIGRALAALGYGTQFAPELDEGERIVDAPAQMHSNEERNVPSLQWIKRQIYVLGLCHNPQEWQAWKQQVLGEELDDMMLGETHRLLMAQVIDHTQHREREVNV